jgi:hypothetical protein
MTDAEKKEMSDFCNSDNVNCDKVQIHEGKDGWFQNLVRTVGTFISRGRTFTLGNHIYVGDQNMHNGTVRDYTLAHELTHVFQLHALGAEEYWDKMLRIHSNDIFGDSNAPYQLPSVPGGMFFHYGLEQQGQIVEDCFGPKVAWCTVSPFRPYGGARPTPNGGG